MTVPWPTFSFRFTSFRIVSLRSRSFRTVSTVHYRDRDRPSPWPFQQWPWPSITVMDGHGHGDERSRWWTVETVWNGPERSGTVLNEVEQSGTKWKSWSRSRHGTVTFSVKNERFTVVNLSRKFRNSLLLSISQILTKINRFKGGPEIQGFQIFFNINYQDNLLFIKVT